MNRFLAPLLLPLILTLSLSACQKPTPPAAAIRPVKLITVNASAVQGHIELAGEVRARVESALGFRVGGKIIARHVEAGQRVKKGQVLAELDPRDYVLATQSANSQVQAAQADLDIAKSEYRRLQELRSNGFVSEFDLDRKRVAVSAAEGRLRSLQSSAALEKNRVSDALLRADADGVIINIQADIGTVVAAGQPVLSLAQDGARDVVVEFPEDRRQLAKQTQASVSLWAQPDAKYSATLRELSAVADPMTRTFRARYSIEAPAQALALGQSATLRIELPTQQATIKLPTTALLGDHSQTKVWLFDDKSGVVKGVPVQVLGIDGNQVLVGGLTNGQQVVVAGVHVLIEGQKVRPLTAHTR